MQCLRVVGKVYPQCGHGKYVLHNGLCGDERRQYRHQDPSTRLHVSSSLCGHGKDVYSGLCGGKIATGTYEHDHRHSDTGTAEVD